MDKKGSQFPEEARALNGGDAGKGREALGGKQAWSVCRPEERLGRACALSALPGSGLAVFVSLEPPSPGVIPWGQPPCSPSPRRSLNFSARGVVSVGGLLSPCGDSGPGCGAGSGLAGWVPWHLRTEGRGSRVGGTGPPETQACLLSVERPLNARMRAEVGGRARAVARPVPGPVPDPRGGGTLTPHRARSPRVECVGGWSVGARGRAPGCGLHPGPCVRLASVFRRCWQRELELRRQRDAHKIQQLQRTVRELQAREAVRPCPEPDSEPERPREQQRGLEKVRQQLLCAAGLLTSFINQTVDRRVSGLTRPCAQHLSC